MRLLGIILLLGLTSADGVVHMTQQQLLSKDRNLLPKLVMTKSYQTKGSQLESYQFKNCGDPKSEIVLVSNLTISPDPIPTVGTITIVFRAIVLQQVVSPVKAALTLKKEFLGTWITVPCIDGFGSCSYADFCQILSKIGSCPAPFVQYGVPCHCPLPANNYSLPSVPVDVNIGILPTGGYSAKFDFASNLGPVGCYEIDFTLK